MSLLERLKARKAAGEGPTTSPAVQTATETVRERLRTAYRQAGLWSPGRERMTQPRPQQAAPRGASVSERLMELRAVDGERGAHEMKRILALPIKEPYEYRCDDWIAQQISGVEAAQGRFCPIHKLTCCPETLVDLWNRENILAEAYEAGERAWWVQAQSVQEFLEARGLIAPIGVGWGKTLTTLMIADHAFRLGMAHKMILTVPPSMFPQLMRRDIPWARLRVPVTMPVIPMGGLGAANRRAIAKSDRRGLYVLPHSMFSVKDTSEILKWVSADLFIIDEAHAFKNASAARTRRLMAHFTERDPMLVALSGTLTKKSVRDYRHLMAQALKEGSPLPTSASMASEWAMVIDSEADPSEHQAGALKPLISWHRRCFPYAPIELDIAGFRQAFQKRLVTTTGVVATGDNEIGTTLTIEISPVPDYKQAPNWSALQELLDRLEDEWVTPNGDEIDYQVHLFKWRYELNSMGGYNQLTWPTAAEVAKRRRIDESEAAEQLERAQEHHAALQHYHKDLRDFLKESMFPELDTPFLVGSHFAQYRAAEIKGEEGRLIPPLDLYEKWLHAKELEEIAGGSHKVERDSSYVRVCPFKVDHVVRTAQETRKRLDKDGDKGGILIFVYHTEFGEWLVEALETAGVKDVMHCPAGGANDAKIIDPANAHKTIVASISGHGTGKNLQAFGAILFAQWPRQADVAEQALGRFHRNGQERDEVFAISFETTEFDQGNFAACVNDALYVVQSTGVQQKIIYANYPEIPKLYPSAALRQRGFHDAKMLDRKGQNILKEQFGVE